VDDCLIATFSDPKVGFFYTQRDAPAWGPEMSVCSSPRTIRGSVIWSWIGALWSKSSNVWKWL
jgi:hypothetical protein